MACIWTSWGRYGTLATVGYNVAVLQTEIDPVPDEIADADVVLVRATAFVVGFAVVLVFGWGLLEPAVSRVARVRNRHNQTLREAITRYVQLIVVVVGVAVGLSVAGFGYRLGNSAIVVAAATIALVSPGRTSSDRSSAARRWSSIRSSTSGTTFAGTGGEGEVRSITLRVTRVRTLDGGLVTIPNTTLIDEVVERPSRVAPAE